MNKNTEIGPGYDVCPSCKSDKWKSAKLIILEGTLNTRGKMSGKTTDPGAFSGGLRELLLSDRWFSWDQDINMELGLTTTSGLVEEVKRLMVANCTLVTMPTEPTEPKKIGFFEKIRPKEPKKPVLEEPVMPTDKTWGQHFGESTGAAIGFAIITWVVVGSLSNFTTGLALAIIIVTLSLPINFVRSFWGNDRAKEDYKNKAKNHPKAREDYKAALQKYEQDLIKYKSDCEAAEKQALEEANAIASYEKKLAEYQREKNNVLKIRELLWERARVCMRCGTGYLGEI
jgi:hypothetical protein